MKIPTRLAYAPQDDEGPPIAWGMECDTLPPDQVKECFKAFMGANFSHGPNRPPHSQSHNKDIIELEHAVPWSPCSQRELHRWVVDYLWAFCAGVVDFIDAQVGKSWRDATVVWIFSVPGSWAKFPVVADFKRLAEDAVSACLPSAKRCSISTEVTEATASALSLLAAGPVEDQQYSVGSTVISCDIGGATTDVAISTVLSPGRLATWPQPQAESVGAVTVEKGFWLHACDTLRNAGVPNPDQLALQMIHSYHSQLAKATFASHQREDRIRMPLPESCNLREWSPSETPSTTMSTIIKNGFFSIHR